MMSKLLHACPAHLGLGASCNTWAMAGMGIFENASEEHLESSPQFETSILCRSTLERQISALCPIH